MGNPREKGLLWVKFHKQQEDTVVEIMSDIPMIYGKKFYLY